MANRVPITRLGKFFGDNDFNLEVEMGQEWLVGDINFTCVLYRVDKVKTKIAGTVQTIARASANNRYIYIYMYIGVGRMRELEQKQTRNQ